MTVHSTHGLFLTCSQESHLHLHNIQLINIYTIHRQLLIKHLARIKNPDLLGGPSSSSWWRIPIYFIPLPSSTAPPFGPCPFHPFPLPSALITVFTTMTSTIMVFFIWDTYIPTSCLLDLWQKCQR